MRDDQDAMTRIRIANGANTVAPTRFASQRKGVSATARVARRFQVACGNATPSTRASANRLTRRSDYSVEMVWSVISVPGRTTRKFFAGSASSVRT